MFYKTGVDITNDKQMFNFLKNHFEYPVLNTWNSLYSIANNVKLYNLNLSGDWWVAYKFLNSGEYDTISWMIQDWMTSHPDFEVYFNGRSCGYLVLKSATHNSHVLPEEIVEAEDYDEYKRFCKEFYGSVRANRDELVYYTKLIQDFDKLCDELRDYCDRLSNLNYEVVEMEKIVEEFNTDYEDDLDLLGFEPLTCTDEGTVDISEIRTLKSLHEVFLRIVAKLDFGYTLIEVNSPNVIKLYNSNR